MNGWNGNKHYQQTDEESAFDADYLRECADIDRREFDEAMMNHVRENGDKSCANPKCVFCNTYGEMMADEPTPLRCPKCGDEIVEAIHGRNGQYCCSFAPSFPETESAIDFEGIPF